jgi:dihydropteroate synthase
MRGSKRGRGGKVKSRIYLRPVGFIDAPFGHDGKAARLAGGLGWFSALEVSGGGGQAELVRVEDVPARLDRWGEEARIAWDNLTAPRQPLTLGGRTVRLDQPQVVGIVNATPDSFSDGGLHPDAASAANAGFEMASAGAAIVDVGGESTRPGAKPVWEQDESGRVVRLWSGSQPRAPQSR